MSKKPSTVNLEESVWNDIELFMKENNVNRNTAIEWMLIERRTLLARTSNTTTAQTSNENKTEETYIEEVLTKNSVVTSNNINSIYAEMPE
jgi:hypothetical protein